MAMILRIVIAIIAIISLAGVVSNTVFIMWCFPYSISLCGTSSACSFNRATKNGQLFLSLRPILRGDELNDWKSDWSFD